MYSGLMYKTLENKSFSLLVLFSSHTIYKHKIFVPCPMVKISGNKVNTYFSIFWLLYV